MYTFYVLPVVFLLAPLGVLSYAGPIEDCPNKVQQILDVICPLCQKLCQAFSVIPKDTLISCVCHPDPDSPDCVEVKKYVDILQKDAAAAVAEAIKECGNSG